MKLKRDAVVVSKDEPFQFDVLGRKENAEILTELLGSIREPLVISIDSPWGTGKTTFIRMWKQHLINLGFRCLYFNAWETDLHSDPLLPLLGEIQAQILTKMGDIDSKAREYFEKAKRIGGGLVRRGIPVIAKIATAGVLNVDEVIETIAAESVGELALDGVKKYEEDRKSFAEFRQQLEGFAKEVEANSKHPIIFFVDELDRCRPSFAIELLERIKHLMSVPGIIFVLAIDLDQLESAVKTVYGLDMKFDGYLRRFIDLHYRLPAASVRQFCSELYQELSLDDYFVGRIDTREEGQSLLDAMVNLFEIYALGLRTQEQCFVQISVALKAFPKKTYIFPIFLAFLIVLKAKDPGLYYRFMKNQIDAQKVLVDIGRTPAGKSFLGTTTGRALEAFIVCAHVDTDELGAVTAVYVKGAADTSSSDSQRERCKHILAIIENFRQRNFGKFASHLQKRVELLERFSV